MDAPATVTTGTRPTPAVAGLPRGFGRCYVRGRTWWIRYWHLGKERRESAKNEDVRVAEKLLKKRWKQIGKGTLVGPKEEKVTVGRLLDGLERDYAHNGRRSSLSFLMTPLRAYFETARAVDVTGATIEQYKAQRLAAPTRRWRRGDAGAMVEPRVRATTAPATVNRELAALKRAFRLGIEQERLASAPVIKLLAEHNARQGFVEPGTFAELVAHLPEALADAARFAYTTGWRADEVFSLRWADVDLDGRRITLRREESKNDEPRVVKLTGEMVDLMARRWAARTYQTTRGPALSVYVFHDQGERFKDIRKRWDRACRAIGTRGGQSGLLFHDLRRSAVRNMDRAGVTESVAMKISGHKTSSVYRRYRIVDEEDIERALAVTQAAIAHAPATNVTPLTGTSR
jgi:integrase